MTERCFIRSIAIAAILPFLLAVPSTAQQGLPTAKIDEVIESEMRAQHIPGVSLAVVKDGQIALAKGYGLANVELGVPVKPETIFQSGSLGKQFTAAAVMMLVEEGKLSLDDPLTKFFPNAPRSWKGITVQRVLTHTAGMTDYPDDFDLRHDYTEDEMLKIVEKIPPAFKPGERWSYSNLGYVTLGILIRKMTGKFYGDVLQERIFGPLGMTTARVISEADIVPNRADGYRLVKGELKNQEWVSPVVNTTADGSLYLTVLDMAKWDAALYTEKLLKRSSFEQIWAPVKLNSGRTYPYGFGWRTSQVRGHRVVFHGGAWQGFECFIVRFVDDRLTIVFFTNLHNADTLAIARRLSAVFFPDFSTAVFRPIDDKEPKVRERVNRALERLADGTVDRDLFTPEAVAALSPNRTKRIAEQLNSLTSPAASLSWELVERREENGLRIYRYAYADLGTTVFATVSLTKDDKIADLAVSAE